MQREVIPMSITRFIITGVAGIGIVSAGAYALDQTTRNDQGTIIESGELGVFSFQAGDCISNLDMDAMNIEKATGVPCAQKHQAEVFAETYFADNSETRPAEFNDKGNLYCDSQFATFVGRNYEDSTLDYIMLYPLDQGWKDGDREITCIIFDPAGFVIGSLRGANR